MYTKESGKTEFRHFLDNQQYQTSGILRYERIFGQGYVSTGGFETTKVCIQQNFKLFLALVAVRPICQILALVECLSEHLLQFLGQTFVLGKDPTLQSTLLSSQARSDCMQCGSCTTGF